MKQISHFHTNDPRDQASERGYCTRTNLDLGGCSVSGSVTMA
jgi:hypothetical protein